MFRKVLVLMAIVLIFSTCEVKADVINSNWVGGEDGDWENPSNWNPPIVPDNNTTDTFAVTIDAGTDRINVELQYGHAIDSMRCYGEVEFQPRLQYAPVALFLLDPNGLTNYGEVGTIAWGIRLIEISGNVNNTSGATLDFWGSKIGGDLVNPAGGSVEVNGDVEVDGNVTNDGDITIGDHHDLEVRQQLINSGRINIYGGGYNCETFDNNSTGVITGFGIIYVGPPFVNKGKICAFGGSLVVGSEGSLTNTGLLCNDALSSLHIKPSLHTEPPQDVNNSGTIQVNAGGGVAFDCNLINEPNGVIKLLGGTLAATTITQRTGATFEGFGGISGNVALDPNAEIKFTASTSIVGNLEIDENATLEINDGLTLVTGQTVCNGTIHMKGGYIIPQGGLSGNCNIIWEPGIYTNAADFNLDGQVNFEDFAYMADTWLWQTAWH